MRGAVAATARHLEQFRRHQPRDLAGEIGLEQQAATAEPGRQSWPAGPSRRTTSKLEGERRSREKEIERCPHEIPAQRRPVQRETAGESEMPVDEVVDPIATALDIPACCIADDGAGNFRLYSRALGLLLAERDARLNIDVSAC